MEEEIMKIVPRGKTSEVEEKLTESVSTNIYKKETPILQVLTNKIENKNAWTVTTVNLFPFGGIFPKIPGERIKNRNNEAKKVYT